MKKFLVASAGAIALFAALAAPPAVAADMPVKAPAPVVAVWTWDGFYIGLNGGYSWGRSRTTADYFNNTSGAFLSGSSSTFDLNGGVFGGQLGFNVQRGSWVWGLEGDIQWSGQKGDTAFTCSPTGACNNLTFGAGLNVPVTASFEQKLSWFATVRGRLGVTLTPTVLAYVTGGLAIGHIETEGVLSGFTAASAPTSAAFNYDKTKLGWTVGGGLEGRLTGNWTGKLEYIYADYGSVSGTALLTTNVIPLRAEFSSKVTDHVIRAGINYKWGSTPVVARY